MAICKFFQQGHCRKGFDCDFEHIKTEKNTQLLPETRKSKRKQNSSSQIPTISNINSAVTKETKGGMKKKKKYNKKKQQQQQPSNPNNKGYSNTAKNENLGYNTQKLPSYPQNPTSTPSITIKDYVDMVMMDLSLRPALWHFSSYGLSLNSTQSLPFPFLGTTEISAEELRLQVYAEAAATGGRIDNYLKVVGEIKGRAEMTTKALIPNLEKVISDLLRSNNVNMNTQLSGLSGHQEALKQTLRERLNTSGNNTNALGNPSIPSNPSNNIQSSIPQQHPQQVYHEPLIQLPQQLAPSPSSSSSNMIIPDDAFSFGSIPELPPSL